MEGRHFVVGPWRMMAHGFVFGVYTSQGGFMGLAMVPEFIENDFGGRRLFSCWLLAQVRLR